MRLRVDRGSAVVDPDPARGDRGEYLLLAGLRVTPAAPGAPRPPTPCPPTPCPAAATGSAPTGCAAVPTGSTTEGVSPNRQMALKDRQPHIKPSTVKLNTPSNGCTRPRRNRRSVRRARCSLNNRNSSHNQGPLSISAPPLPNLHTFIKLWKGPVSFHGHAGDGYPV